MSIEQWVCCLYMAVMAKKRPDCLPDLLAHSSIIVNASRLYDGLPWLDSDIHFRRTGAADPIQSGVGGGGVLQDRFLNLDLAFWRGQVQGNVVLSLGTDPAGPKKKSKESTRARSGPYPSPSSSAHTRGLCWLYNSSEGCDFSKTSGRPCRFRVQAGWPPSCQSLSSQPRAAPGANQDHGDPLYLDCEHEILCLDSSNSKVYLIPLQLTSNFLYHWEAL